MTPSRLIPAGLLAGLVLLAGCGGGNGKTTSTAAPTSTPAAAATTTVPATTTATAPANPKLAHKPVIGKSSGRPPSKLVVQDLVKGTGVAAKAGDTVTVQYVGASFATGKQFDASWDRNQPFPFQLGAGMVIPGWDRGIPGMRVGGRRKLTIPPGLAYGARGSPPAIAPNETLVFVVDLVGVQGR